MKILANTEKGQLILSDVVACRLFGFSRLCFFARKNQNWRGVALVRLARLFDELEEENNDRI